MILISLAFNAYLLMFLLIMLLKVIIKNAWPSLYNRLFDSINFYWLAVFPFYILCFYMTIQLAFCSPFFIPSIAKFYISKDLKDRYKANFNVIKIEKYISNQIGGTNGFCADVQIGNSKDVIKVHYGLSLFGILMEYSHDDLNDLYTSQFSKLLTEFFREKTGYKEVLCYYTDFSYEAAKKLIEPNAELQFILCQNKGINGRLIIYDFYIDTINYDRLYNLVERIRELNFQYLSIVYAQYEPDKMSYIAENIKRNAVICIDNMALSTLIFNLEEIEEVGNANQLSQKVK